MHDERVVGRPTFCREDFRAGFSIRGDGPESIYGLRREDYCFVEVAEVVGGCFEDGVCLWCGKCGLACSGESDPCWIAFEDLRGEAELSHRSTLNGCVGLSESF